MNKYNIIFIGLDTHKAFNEVVYSEENRSAKPVHMGLVPSSKVAL